MENEKLPKAIDLSHHLSEFAKARQTSPLKGLQRYWGKPGVISLAGGLPSPAYFPISTLSADTLVSESFALAPPERATPLSWLWKLFGAGPTPKEKTEHLSIPKYAAKEGDIALEQALQYGMATGLPPLTEFIRDFTGKVYQPQYEDFATLLHAGNTDGWFKAVMTLCNPGDLFLTEEWTYPSALSTAQPLGVRPVSVKMDGEGMRSDDLRKVLSEWNADARGAKRPHLMYTVPIGQNPTGNTMGATRKKEIYDICVEFDVIIVEDDPYYFLQEGAYVPKSARVPQQVAKGADQEAAYIATLAPSYLKFDYQGRVVRLDSFSKTIAPGSRLGWFTCNAVFAERFERQGETSTQAPCGFGQSVIATLLTKQWGYEGFIRWLRGLRTEYTTRRDFFIDCLADEFHLQPSFVTNGAWSGCTAYTARAKIGDARAHADEKRAFGQKPLFTFIPPSAGMFVWFKIELESHPAFAPEERDTLDNKLWVALAEAGLLVGPGWIFGSHDDMEPPTEGHLRISFSNAEYEDMKKAVVIMGKVFREFFEV